MPKILMIHNTELSNAAFKSKFATKYNHFGQKGSWSVVVKKPDQKIAKARYTRIYFDMDSVTETEIAPIIAKIGKYIDTIGVSLSDSAEKRKRMKIGISKKVTNLSNSPKKTKVKRKK